MNVKWLRQQWNSGQTVFNFFLTEPSPFNAEQYAALGFETLTLDLQHSLIEDAQILAMVQAIKAGGSLAMARLKWNRPELVMKALDYGIPVLICPMIDRAQEAADFVKAAKYPPLGNRSFGPVRAGLEGNYFAEANKETLTFAMIETAGAANDLEAIAATPGLDGLYIGPFDLSVSLGLEKKADFSDSTLQAVINQVLQLCQDKGLYSGIFSTQIKDAQAMAKKGFNLVTCGTDGLLLQQSGQQWWSSLKKT
ncbi:MAG: aldolase/citrate lyase family protein [Saprospiraceae bacterium]